MENDKKKIAIIVPGLLPMPPVKGGAVETLLYNVITENEKRKKLQLVIYSTYDKDAVEASKGYVETEWKYYKAPNIVRYVDCLIFRVLKLLGRKNLQGYRFMLQRLYYIYKIAFDLHVRNDIDVVVLDNHITLCLILRFWGNFKKYKGRIVYHIHNVLKGSFGQKSVFTSLDKYFCISKYIMDYLAANKIPKEKLSVLANVVDTKRFSYRMSKEEIIYFKRKNGINENERIVFFAGRIEAEKGIKEAILGFKKANLKNTKLVIAGGTFYGLNIMSTYEKEIKNIVDELSTQVIMLGYVSYEEMPKWYQCSDVGLFPSIWDEPAGLTCIEARSSGLPVITTISGGIPEYIKSDFGVLLPVDEKLVKNIADSLNLLLSDPMLLENMGKRALEYSQKYNLSTYYEDFYQQITGVIKESK